MAAIVRNYTIERGIPFSRLVTITDGTTPLDLTDVTLAAKARESMFPTDIRAWPTGTGPLVTNFDLAVVGAPTDGKFTLALSIQETLLLKRGTYDYDVVLTFSNGEKRRILKGVLTAVEITSHAD